MFLEILPYWPFIADKREDGGVDDGADRCVGPIVTSPFGFPTSKNRAILPHLIMSTAMEACIPHSFVFVLFLFFQKHF